MQLSLLSLQQSLNHSERGQLPLIWRGGGGTRTDDLDRSNAPHRVTLAQHIENGSSVSSQFVSGSKCFYCAVEYAANSFCNTPVVYGIDASQVPSTKVFDCSHVDGCLQHGVAGKAMNYAKKVKEVVFEDSVPREAVKVVLRIKKDSARRLAVGGHDHKEAGWDATSQREKCTATLQTLLQLMPQLPSLSQLTIDRLPSSLDLPILQPTTLTQHTTPIAQLLQTMQYQLSLGAPPRSKQATVGTPVNPACGHVASNNYYWSNAYGEGLKCRSCWCEQKYTGLNPKKSVPPTNAACGHSSDENFIKGANAFCGYCSSQKSQPVASNSYSTVAEQDTPATPVNPACGHTSTKNYYWTNDYGEGLKCGSCWCEQQYTGQNPRKSVPLNNAACGHSSNKNFIKGKHAFCGHCKQKPAGT
eukprot:TRINITY_DN32200_c0_g1_i1.p1 TRINITY_DN32200_c0_g1~~TRINITY_DN32200_c0_g1_i1.p1  ORF type:complete len:415 (-),score=61.26 TRINITY_DN32200_c0_g1_i1:62-1306(-)